MFNFQFSIAEEEIEKLPDRKRNLVCYKNQCCRKTCLQLRQIGALHAEMNDLEYDKFRQRS